MPKFSYVCKDCDAVFDILVGVCGEDEKKICKICGSKNIKKIFTSFSVGTSSRKNTSNPACGGCRGGPCPF